jgi:hypothetical protein
MYHPDVITARIEAFERSRDGFKLFEHSVAKCEEWVEHLDAIWDHDAGRVKASRKSGALNDEERRWIRNERKMCKYSYIYAATRYFKIVNERKEAELFKPRIPQLLNMEIWKECEVNQWSIEIIQLKSRQLGLSTQTELAVAHRVLFWPRTYAFVASSDPEKSAEMAGMLEFVVDNLPWWLGPVCTAKSAGKSLEFGGINTKVAIQHGNKMSGIARGRTPNVIHLSELPDFEDPEELVDASLLPAIHPHPSTFFIMESTGKKIGDWYYKCWQLAKKGKGRFRPAFLPWHTGTYIKPTPTWLAMNPVPTDWEPLPTTIRHAQRAEDYVRRTPFLSKLLGDNYSISQPMLWWWERTRDEYYEKGELHKFLAENPGNDTEAFQSETTSVFTAEEMESFANDVREPKWVYAISGDEINERHQPYRKEVDPDAPVIDIPVTLQRQTPRRYAFTPIRWAGYEKTGENWQGRLLVWEAPQPTEHYALGIDTAYGMGQDSSVIQVIRLGSLYRYDEQVAEFASPFISAEVLWPYALAIGTWYAQPHLRRYWPRQVIECNALGRVVQWELKKRGWPNFHPWVQIDRKHVRPGKVALEGWFTNTKTRHEMMSKTVRALKDGLLQINSQYLVHEMQGLQKDIDDAAISSDHGFHDDLFMALGFCYYSSHFMEVESVVKARPVTRDEQLATLPTYGNSRRSTQYLHQDPSQWWER